MVSDRLKSMIKQSEESYLRMLLNEHQVLIDQYMQNVKFSREMVNAISDELERRNKVQ